MSQRPITIVRVYTLEGHDHLNQVLHILRDEQKIAGVTVIRGIAGTGAREKCTPHPCSVYRWNYPWSSNSMMSRKNQKKP